MFIEKAFAWAKAKMNSLRCKPQPQPEPAQALETDIPQRNASPSARKQTLWIRPSCRSRNDCGGERRDGRWMSRFSIWLAWRREMDIVSVRKIYGRQAMSWLSR